MEEGVEEEEKLREQNCKIQGKGTIERKKVEKLQQLDLC